MTHRGPFQPLLFCDSVISHVAIQADIKTNLFQGNPRLRGPSGAATVNRRERAAA